MRKELFAYLFTTLVFFGMDFIWLSLTATPVYKARLGSLMLDKPNLPVALGFYLLYVIAVVVFAVMPAVQDGSWWRALGAGALLGLTAYGTYDLTNLATLAGWSLSITVIDMLWGMVATASAATAGYFLTRWLS